MFESDRHDLTLFLDQSLTIVDYIDGEKLPFHGDITTAKNLEEVFSLSSDTKNWITAKHKGKFTGLILYREDEYNIELYRLNSTTPITANITPVKDTNSAFSSLALVDAGAIVLDKDLSIISSSSPCQEYFGIDIYSKIGETIWRAIPDLKQDLERPISQFLATNEYDFIQLHYKPTSKWFDIRCHKIKDDYIILFNDITRIKTLESKTKNNEAFLTKILDHIFDGLVVIDTSGEVILANKSIERISGYRSDELVGNNISMLMESDQGRIHNSYLDRGKNSKTPHVVNLRRTIKLRKKDGAFTSIDIAVTELKLADKLVFIGSIRDISKQLEQEKRITELARFPEENWNPVLKIEENGIVSYANPSSDILLSFWGVAVNDEAPVIYKDIAQGSISSGDPQLIQIDCGDTIYDVLFSPAQELRCVYVYGSDITKNVQYEKELLEHRTQLEAMIESRTRELANAKDEALLANQAKSAFLANMSHEMRTPLTAIVGYAETLLDDDLTEEERLKAADTIIRSSLHLKEIINDVLDISKIEAEKLDLENIETSVLSILNDVYSVMDPLAREKSLDFKITFESAVPKIIQTDPTRLKQILINLCSNAIKFTPTGSIEIRLSTLKNDNIKFSVIDSGIGIPAESLERIFDKFAQADSSTTRQYGGTGLGLSLSKQLAVMLGGNLEVSSELKKGSQFSVHINPGQYSDETINQFSQQRSSIKHGDIQTLSGRVLVVEDTPALQDLVKMMLSKLGLTPDLAENGKIGVEKATQGNYDLILMDIQMPELDGIKATEMLRESGYRSPIVAMTANATKRDKITCFDAGFSDFLSKPIDKEKLTDVLIKYLEKNMANNRANIKSELLNDEPDMLDLVKKFVDTLPNYISSLADARQKDNWDVMQTEIHKLKGLGGGYGYPLITELAMDIEDILKAGNYELVDEKLAVLSETMENIINTLEGTSK